MYSLPKPLRWTILLILTYVFLFHDVGSGLNVLIFEFLFISIMLFAHGIGRSLEFRLSLLGLITTAFMMFLHASALSSFLNKVFLLLFLGMTLAPNMPSYIHAFSSGLFNVLHSLGSVVKLPFSHPGLLSRSGSFRGWLLAIFPIGILLVFLLLYRAANPEFDKIIGSIGDKIWDYWVQFWSRLNLFLILDFFIAAVISAMVLIKSQHPFLNAWASRFNERLERKRKPLSGRHKKFGMTDLRMEKHLAIGLLIGLNVLLALLNVLDIKNVWLGFNFQGEYLRSFVHIGTYMLIFSVLLGIAVVLYYFRANINFMKNNRLLKVLSYTWLIQNAVLCISLFIRLYWYIHYYGLAYKRIGVILFLIATVIGLLTVYLKVSRVKSGDFLIRWNLISVLMILTVASLFSWDVIIAKYNFAQKDQSFIHLDFMATLSDKALPYLIKEERELEEIYSHNKRMSSSFSSEHYSHPRQYGAIIEERIQQFLIEYPKRSWKEWNYADWKAYRMLTKE